MEAEPIFRRKGLLAGLRFAAVDLAQGFEHVPTFIGEIRGDADKLAAAVGQTLGHKGQRRRHLGQIAGESITDLDWRAELDCALGQDGGEVSPACLRPVKNSAIR
jgi:hypothetical protein